MPVASTSISENVMDHEPRFEKNPREMLERDLLGIRETALDSPADLKPNAAEVYAVLAAGLRTPELYYRTTETIFTLIAVAVQDIAWKAWFDPIADLVDQHPVMPHNPYQAGFREVVADFRPLVGAYGRLNEVRITVVADLMKAYVKLLKVLIFHHSMSIPHELLEQAEKVSRRLGDHIETDAFYQTLALFYTHYGDPDAAKQYGRLAFTDASYIQDGQSTLDAATILAIIYRGAQEYKPAGYYLDRAMDQAEAKKPDKLLATLFYEYGIHCYRHDRFELALSYYARALSIFEEYEAHHQITMAKHAMTQAYVYMHAFEKAEPLLAEVRREWQHMGNQYDYVNTFFVEAEMEVERGNRGLGLRLLNETEGLAIRTLECTPARDRMIDLIRIYRGEHR